MKRINLAYQTTPNYISSINNNLMRTKKSLSDEEIINLQDSFLMPGFSLIQVPDLRTGRNILNLFLDSLKCYNDMAFISTYPDNCAGFKLPVNMINLYNEFINNNIINNIDKLEEYLLGSFYYDFLAVELTQELLGQAWFCKFEQLLIDYNFAENTPIVLFSYQA